MSTTAIDTRLILKQVQAQVAQKDSKTRDLKPEEKLQTPSNESKDVKVPQMYGSQKPPLSTSPATKEATAPPTKEATAPCSKLSAKAPVEDASFDDLHARWTVLHVQCGFRKSWSFKRSKTGVPRGNCRAVPSWNSAGPSKTPDSSLSPERNTGINNASLKSDTSPKPRVSPAACSCSARPAVVKGFHPKDIDIPYIDDA